MKTIGLYLDDTFDIDDKILNVDIVDDFIIITTNDNIITGKIRYDFSKSDLIFNELNKYEQGFYNNHTYKSASYWLDSVNKNVVFADIDHKNDDIEIYYINSQTNEKTTYNIDNSDIDFDYNNLISFKYISKPQIIKNSNDIYLITLISDICENYYYQIIKYNLISKNEIKSIYNRIYHPSKLNINKNIRDEPEDSRVDSLTSFYSDDKLYTNSIIYRWDNETETSLEYNLTYSPYVKETYYDNDVKYNIDKYKPSLKYLLSDLVQNIDPVENGSNLDKKYTFNGENIYAPIDILMDFRDINDFDSYISRSEPIYKIEYHINGKIQTHHITYDGDVEIEEKYFDTGISPLSGLGGTSSNNLYGLIDKDDDSNLIGLNTLNEPSNPGYYNNTFSISPINEKYISFCNDTNNFDIVFYSLSGSKITLEFKFEEIVDFSLSEKYAKVELLDAQIKYSNTGQLDCLLYLNTRNPDSIINTSILKLDSLVDTFKLLVVDGIKDVDEGDLFTVKLITYNVPNGAKVPYSIYGVESLDIRDAALVGEFIVENNEAEIEFITSKDKITEGDEIFNLKLDNNRSEIFVTIKDT